MQRHRDVIRKDGQRPLHVRRTADAHGERLALGDDEFEPPPGADGHAQHGQGAFLDLELDPCAGAGLAVEDAQAAQDRLFGSDVEVVRAVVAHQHRAALEIERAEQAIDKVDDVYVASEHDRPSKDPDKIGSVRGTTAWDRAVRQQERSRVIGPANEVVSYELWLYSGSGSPLTAEDRSLTIDGGLRVLFVDLEGYGRFRLRKSSVRLDVHGLAASY